MTTDIILADASQALDALPPLREAAAIVLRLVEEGAAGTLDEARRQSEARALYEKRTHSQERANHYSKLRLLAEAGLGVLSFEDPQVVPAASRRSAYRALAAALERGRFVDVCDKRINGQSFTADSVAHDLRGMGVTYVPGRAFDAPAPIPWSRARIMARDAGIALSTLPLDRTMRDRMAAAAVAQSERMGRLYESEQRERRARISKAVAAAASERGPRTDIAYGRLRQALQALDAALQEAVGEEREDLEAAMVSMYSAEEHIGKSLGVVPRDEYHYDRKTWLST